MYRRRLRIFRLVALAAFGFATAAHAQESPGLAPAPVFYPPRGAEPAAGDPAPVGQPQPAPVLGQPPPEPVLEQPGSEPVPTTGEGERAGAIAAKPMDPSAAMYGVAARWRWISVPGWFLDLFTQKNVPLSTFSCFGLEGFRRKVDKDDPTRTWEVVVGLGYQNMSPPDGYWLGRNKDKAQDTDLVQARDLSLITMDAAFVSRQYFGPYFGVHYGAGLGMAIVRGKLLRTSAQYDPNNGQFQVRNEDGQVMCDASANCNETLLNQSQGAPDTGPTGAHRFQETGVPGALPIINLLLGIDIRIPIPEYHQAVELRLEGGFFDAFFVGLGVGYQM